MVSEQLKMRKQVDIIVVGQGIAGTCLTHQLMAAEQSVLVIDNDYKHSSSIVAAGMVNPIVFKRLTKCWHVDLLLPAMHSFFKELEINLQAEFIHPIPILKIFTSTAERSQWEDRSTHPDFIAHFGDLLTADVVEKCYQLKAPFGAGTIQSSLTIDLSAFLTKSRDHFEKNGSYLEHEFNFNKITLSDNGGVYATDHEDIHFKKIVFCEGYKGIDNPYFKGLPFNLSKGEIIEFKHPRFQSDKIINNNGFILPTKQNTFKLGATYEWQTLDQNTTDAGRERLLDKLSFLNHRNIEVTNQVAGIRPTVKDRRPLIGQHPTSYQLFIFNGLGTKGALIAPYYATQMVDLIVRGLPVDTEVDIKRFNS